MEMTCDTDGPIMSPAQLTALERARLVGATDAARIAGVSPATIRRLRIAGKLAAVETRPGWHGYKIADVSRISAT